MGARKSGAPVSVGLNAVMHEARSTAKNGIAIVANDKIIDWLLPFLESYRATNAATDLYLIPYDDNVRATRQAAENYGVIWADGDFGDLDRLAQRLYPFSPYRRRRLRKLYALGLPLDRVIYMDVDTILFRDFRPVFECLQPGETDFIIASTSNDYVYNNSREDHAFLRNAKLFSDGFFLTSRHIVSVSDFHEVIDRDERLFHAIRKRGGLYAQPFVNFVVHRRELHVRSLSECLPGASDESYYKAKNASFRDDGPVDCHGNAIYFAHWAGALSMPHGRVFDDAWQHYARKAATSVKT